MSVHIEYVDHRKDPGAWAADLGISREAVDLYLASDVIDLHVDSFIWKRVFGYDLTKRHGQGLLAAAFYSQVDFPRAREAQLSGAMWSITTNPLRREGRRPEVFLANLRRLRQELDRCSDDFAIVRNLNEYRAARRAGKHAVWIVIQGGNALDAPGALDRIPDDLVVRVTLVHLSTSSLGATSAPFGGSSGLTQRGRDYVRALNSKRIFVDLAHIHRKGFFDAVEVHDKSQPLIVTHTGVCGVHRHWRNLEDDQIRAVADTGGTIGIMYQSTFLGDPLWGGRAESVVRHMEHVVSVAGDDFASLGSDWDGAIVPPRDMRTCVELPKLVQIMLDRKWPTGRVQKVLGGNFLRALGLLRGTDAA